MHLTGRGDAKRPAIKSGSPSLGSRSQDAPNRTYPDQADFANRGDGLGLNNMAHIIHDFMHYNRNVEENLAERMRSILPAAEWQLLQRVAQAARDLKLPLYIVGGLPRDLILGIPSKDFDLVVEGRAEHLAKSLAGTFGGRVVVHKAFGTAKWEVPAPPERQAPEGAASDALDIITARSETYKHPGALPTVAPGTIADDLRRRDFTINAIAIRLDGSHVGEVRDDLDGRKDLQQGIVRVLHPASFIDDPTRMYRAVRYEQRYGFRIAQETLRLLPGARGGVSRLSAQRVRHELDLILDEQRADAMLRRLVEVDLLKPVHPALSYDAAAANRMAAAEQAPPLAVPVVPRRGLRWLLWLMELPAAEIEAIDSRLHFSAELRRDLLAASELSAQLDSLVGLPPSGWHERLSDVRPAAAYAVYLSLEPGEARTALERYLSEWRHIRPKTTGHDLQQLGVKPGAEYHRILRELRRAWIDGEIESEQDERDYLQRLLGE